MPQSNEQERLQALHGLSILDTEPEPQFDNLVRLVARAFDAPAALVSLVSEDRQWFKARFGVEAREAPREIAFCDHAIRASQVLVVPDATRDDRFAANPLVAGPPGIRFYAGAPLTTPDGHRVGTLCIIDYKPRDTFSDADVSELRALADGVMQALSTRAEAIRGLQDSARATERDELLAMAERMTRVGTWMYDVREQRFHWSNETSRIYGRDPAAGPLDREELLAYYHPDDGRRVGEFIARAVREGLGYESQSEIRRCDGTIRQVASATACRRDERGEVVALFGTIQDITDLKLADAELRASEARRRLLTDNATDLIVQCDAAGLIEFASPSARRWGYDAAELVGRPMADFIHPDDQVGAMSWFDRTLAGEPVGAEGRHELRCRAADARWVWFEGNPAAISDDKGKPLGMVVTLRDVTEARAARQAIAESEARFRLITESATDVIVRYDLGGRIEYVSPGVRHYGYDPKDVVGRDLAEFLEPGDLERNQRFLADLSAGLPVPTADQNVWRSRDANGAWVWLEGVTSPISDGEGRVIGAMAVLRDITERRANQDALAASEARFRLLTEQASDIIVRANPQGCIEYISPACRILGFTADEMLGRPMTEFVHPDERPRAIARYGELLQTGSRLGERREYRLLRKDGSSILADGMTSLIRDDDGAILGTVSHLRDITDQRAAEAAVAESEAKYRLLAENATDVIASCSLDGVITYVSPSAERLYGYTVAEMIGSDAGRLIHPDDKAMVFERLRDMIVSKQRDTAIRYEYRAINKAGEVVWLEANPSVVCDPRTGRVVALQDCLRDITQRKQLEAELVRKRAEAEGAAVAKAEFLSNMSHELRTPLTGVIGFAGLLEGMEGLPEKARAYARRVTSGGEALLAIVNDILDFTKLEAGQVELDPQPFDAGALVAEAIELVQVQASRKGLSLRQNLSGALPAMVTADGARVRQVLLNLLSNAIKFTAHGEVVVALSHDARNGGRLLCTVTDTGIGIPEGLAHRLFQRFSQIDGSISREYGGTGLGLAICKGLVQMMGGEIGVESREGAGSTFWFTIAAPAAPTMDGPTVAAVDGGPAALRILVVDDVEMNRELLVAMLAPLGAELVEAADGLEAVAASMRSRFDVILMDLQMPGMDGYAATRAIRANSEPNRTTPILAISANVLPKHVAACREAGMDDYVAKPIDHRALIDKITHYAPQPKGKQPSRKLRNARLAAR